MKIVTITDSPKPRITSGFANVARPILRGFHDYGFEVYAFGTMDVEPDIKRELPYVFQPANPFDESGHRTISLFLVNVQPDAIFVMYDPGNVLAFVNIIISLQDSGNLRRCPIVIYIPIEGFPVPLFTARLIETINKAKGRVVLYSPGMVELVQGQYPEINNLEFAYHGLDHAPFRQYEPQERADLRAKVGWTDDFVVGSVGVNKRTKGMDYIIYTARCLKDMGKSEGIKFYLHTSPNQPIMLGYNLEDMVDNYDVRDMVIFKPEKNDNTAGIEHQKDAIYQANDDSADEKTKVLSSLSFIDRLNMLDCYLDLSQVEGWGLPAHEAMRCGVPTISVKDKSIREEVYSSGAMMLDAEPFRTWTTWHTGAKLVLVDPAKAAEAVLEMKNADPAIRKFWSTAAMANATQRNWAETQKKFIDIVNEVVKNYDYDNE